MSDGKPKPLPLAIKLQNLLKVCADARAVQREQAEIIKAALDEARDNDGFEPAVVRKLIAYRERADKDPAETARVEELTDQYKFMADGGSYLDMPEKADSEIDRVMALCSGSKPPKIEAIKKALGCSQGKAHKLRSVAVARLAMGSRSRDENEHEHLAEDLGFASNAPPVVTPTSAPEQDAPIQTNNARLEMPVAERACGDVESRHVSNVRPDAVAESSANEIKAVKSDDAVFVAEPSTEGAGVATGPQDLDPLQTMSADELWERVWQPLLDRRLRA